ncbi:MAG: zinc finger protein [Anaerolineales bacterium]
MARKVKGYIELYWKCPGCGSENLGSHAYCTSCGSPQPQNVDFHQGSRQQLVTDTEKLKKAKTGADIHCGFCGTRNPTSATSCTQCGSDLVQGKRRAAGKVVGAFAEGAAIPVKCATCGTMNAGTRLKCGSCGSPLAQGAAPKKVQPAAAGKPIDPKVLLIGGAVVLLLCAAIYFLFFRTQSVVGTVTATNWTRSVAIEAFGPVELEDWRDELPAAAEDLSCREQVRQTQDEPRASGRYDEVCGTPYNVDTGGGFAEVVQDCEYRVYDDFCSYTIEAWALVATAELEGIGLNARWPSPALTSNQRLGEEEASYACIFDAGAKSYTYTTESFEQFSRCLIGSTWTLEVNALGGVSAIIPAD